MKEVRIRQENKDDHAEVFSLVEAAFRDMEHADGDEHYLVERLRNSADFIPELCLVAELDNKIIGHILLSRVRIVNEFESHVSLALAPISVHPDYQRRGVGSKLIHEAHKRAMALGFGSVILIGHEGYYPRFGYVRCSSCGISMPFEAPDENCMVAELKAGALEKIRGRVEFAKEFLI